MPTSKSNQLAENNIGQLIEAAQQAKIRAYAPYSRFPVGAAILCKDGEIVGGCNVESQVYGLGICAERAAIVNAITQGFAEFCEMVIVASPIVPPCGACRQLLAEFANLDLQITSIDAMDLSVQKKWQLFELLPDAFTLTNGKRDVH